MSHDVVLVQVFIYWFKWISEVYFYQVITVLPTFYSSLKNVNDYWQYTLWDEKDYLRVKKKYMKVLIYPQMQSK